MARKKTWGTPGGRLRHYVFPRPWFPRLVLGLILGGAVAGFLLLLQLGGSWLSPLREPLMPGALAGTHSTIANCEACHDTARGVPNFRCQRCHDESGPGRMTQTAHAGRHIPRQTDARPTEAAEDLDCVTCHLEHRGRQATLSVVSDSECAACHGAARETAEGPRPRISDFDDHPEFGVVLADRKAKASGNRLQQVTGIFFSHAIHLRELSKKLRGVPELRLCQECHKLEGPSGTTGHREFAPISLDADCVSCHRDELVVEGAPAADLVLESKGAAVPFTCDARVFSCGDTVVKNAVTHRDPWLLLNLRKLRRELYPAEHAREYGDLLARAARLRRRLFLAQPLAVLAANDLKPRRDAFADDIRKLDARIKARAGVAQDPTGGRSRLEEAAGAASAAQSPGLEALRSQMDALNDVQGGAAPVAGPEFEERRDELLRLLDAVTRSEDADPQRRAQAAYLRLRVLSLAPGEPALDALRRARRQREQDLLRVEDEMGLRQSGISALGNPGKGLREVEARLAEIQARLQELKSLEVFPEAPTGDRGRKEAAMRALAGEDHVRGCAKCHEIKNGTLAPVTASRPVLTLADFRHEPHLTATPPDPSLWRRLTGRAAPASAASTCASCHPGVVKSTLSTDLHMEPISSCRECHGARAQRQDCQLCHRYHPPFNP